jgi:hypothetical protein
MPSFQRLTELALVIERAGGEAPWGYCRAQLRLTPLAAMPLLEDAVAAEVIELREDGVCRLLPPGVSIAAAMVERLASAERRSIEAFQPYTTYFPERWWPEPR